MFAKKASQPSSDKSSNCLLLARLLPTRGHPLSSCKREQKSAKRQHCREWVVRYAITCECMYVCVMCMHIHVCDQWTVRQLHILFEGEVIGMLNNDGIRSSITIVHCVWSMGNCCTITHTQRSTLIITINKVYFEDSNCCTTLLVHSRHFDNSNNVVVVGRTWEM